MLKKKVLSLIAVTAPKRPIHSCQLVLGLKPAPVQTGILLLLLLVNDDANEDCNEGEGENVDNSRPDPLITAPRDQCDSSMQISDVSIVKESCEGAFARRFGSLGCTNLPFKLWSGGHLARDAIETKSSLALYYFITSPIQSGPVTYEIRSLSRKFSTHERAKRLMIK